MKKNLVYHKIVLIFLAFFSSENALAQLGFCQGNSGDPIFTETFGTGTTNSTLPPPGTTTYPYANGFPSDGFYTVRNGSFGNVFDWHQTQDHTVGDVNGKCLIVNASSAAGEFYRTMVSGLCENTTYEFSAWLINLVIAGSYCSTQPGGTIPVNVRFEIWDNSDTNLLASGNTGNITETSTPIWQNFGLVFQTQPMQTQVILKMINNGIGGCGNDLAIDDIVFKTCGDSIEVTDSSGNNNVSLCSSQTPYTTTLIATPDNIVFSNHFYQWQQSVDGVTWIDIVGETSQTVNITGITTTTYYRAKVAEYAANLSNEDCITYSDVFSVIVTQAGAQPPNANCWDDYQLDITTCTWQNNGLQDAQPPNANCWDDYQFNTTTCEWENIGTQPTQPTIECWETVIFNSTLCDWEVTGTQPISSIEEDVVLCEGEDVTLFANTTIVNPDYFWDTGEITDNITVSNPGMYSVEITDGCSTTMINFQVTQIDKPVIENVVSNGSNIIVEMANIGNFLYSLDGIQYQSSNTFFNVENGLYTIHVKDVRGCDALTFKHLHFSIPIFFTPNNDGFQDTFNLNGIENYRTSEVYIFDRYGKLLKSAKNSPLSWDGTFNNQQLPTADYWYIIILDGQETKGHFTLKR